MSEPISHSLEAFHSTISVMLADKVLTREEKRLIIKLASALGLNEDEPSQIYQAVIENNACEQAAKMIAMKNASENAEEIINDLQLLYNNARQASITQELSEIVGGAAAI